MQRVSVPSLLIQDLRPKEEDDEPDNSEALAKGRVFCCVSAKSFLVRFFILFVASSFFFVCTSVDDLVSAAVPVLRKSMHLSALDVSLLYSATPVTAILASLATAILVTRVSIRTLCLGSCILILLGNTIFIYTDNYWFKLIGRAIFGIGEGPLEVLMSLICMRWFIENDPLWPTLEVSFGFTSAAGMLGAAVGLSGIPLLEEYLKPEVFANSIVGFIPALAVLFAVLYWIVDFWADDYLETLQDTEEDDPPVLDIVKGLSTEYWILFFMCGSLWSVIYVIMVFLTDYLDEKWKYTELASGFYSSIVFAVGIPVSIIGGWIVSKKGTLLTILTIGGILFTLSCLILGMTELHPIYGIVGLGVSMGMFEPTMFTAIALVLSGFKGSNTAFTFTALIFQTVVFAAPFAFGALHDSTGSYDLIFIICSLSGVLNVGLTFWLAKLSPGLQNGSILPEEAEEQVAGPEKYKTMSTPQMFFELLLTGFFINLLASILYLTMLGWIVWNGQHNHWFDYLPSWTLINYTAYFYFFFSSLNLHFSWINMFIYKTTNRTLLHVVIIGDVVFIVLNCLFCILLIITRAKCKEPICIHTDILDFLIVLAVFCILSQIFSAAVLFWFRKPWFVTLPTFRDTLLEDHKSDDEATEGISESGDAPPSEMLLSPDEVGQGGKFDMKHLSWD